MPSTSSSPQRPWDPSSSSAESTWTLLLAVNALKRRGGLTQQALGIWTSDDGALHTAEPDDTRARMVWTGQRLALGAGPPPAMRDLVELYLPVLEASADRPLVVGHLGQSLDGRIATHSGDSYYVTGYENRLHLHRMRALCDAVVVGAGTVASDDPRLTVRLAEGPNPVRVVIDPRRRLSDEAGLLNDGAAPTLVVCEQDLAQASDPHAEILGLPRDGDGLSLRALVAALSQRGLNSVFVEGGGVTLTRFMNAGQLDRLQIATAPVLVGDGRPGLALPPAPSMRSSLRPPYRLFRMGEDLLWDFDLRAERGAVAANNKEQGPTRIG